MIGIFLLVVLVATAGWFSWLFLVSPPSDVERIRADQGGTDTKVLKVERTGTKDARALMAWIGDRPAYLTGGRWYRLYNVTVKKPDGGNECYSVAVGVCLFGTPDLQRLAEGSAPSG